jgi:ABC-type sugar transport system substrate-binding protein
MKKSISIVCAFLLLTSFSVLAQDDGVVLGYAAPELTGGQGVIQAGLVNHAEAMGWEVILANANFDAEAQANQIDNFIAQGVDAIVTVPVDSQAICAAAQRAQDAGIPFYTIDRAPIGCAINMTIQSDNFMAGQQSGEELVRLLTERYGEPRGVVLELQGDLGQNVAQLRGGGFHSVVDEYPNIEVIQRPTNWQADVASQAALDVAATSTLDAIYMHSDCNALPPVLAALEQLGQLHARGEDGHIFLAGIDGCPVALDGIRDGFINQELQGEVIEPGEILEEGALWSPAVIADTDTGLMANLSTTSVTPDNVDNTALWGNQDVEGN